MKTNKAHLGLKLQKRSTERTTKLKRSQGCKWSCQWADATKQNLAAALWEAAFHSYSGQQWKSRITRVLYSSSEACFTNSRAGWNESINMDWAVVMYRVSSLGRRILFTTVSADKKAWIKVSLFAFTVQHYFHFDVVRRVLPYCQRVANVYSCSHRYWKVQSHLQYKKHSLQLNLSCHKIPF